ncbi:hypothetical protein IX91_01440 [Vibrio tubiashii ATCC 19109]|uniref:Uncharacterized protein n=2 Tax=Vibrio tubiashii TaxID=29498 RepID=F9TC98_9VIBR|nr:hypothetical protein IX91_01440 [Vibrio tubiashii ATCC 19109]EGU47956.1 hypothetical protein VITU9109_22711 [Vibrio tubiashii ATCC 19109]EIF03387.1 hypothetical protein VT1337_13697 [Vibrio tubiashii NCIMB 1337 = ATCC 19106]
MHFTVSEELCVYYKQRDFTLNFLSNISSALFKHNVKVHLDLTACPNISAAALVMLFAEVSRARMALEEDDVITIELPKEFSDTSWEEAITLHYRKYASLFDNDHTFQTVSEPNKAMASIMKLLFKSGVVLSKPDTRVFTKGVNEAMLNVINHAYSDQLEPLGGIGRRWWQACWLQKKANGDETLVYIIFDLGCGMLKSLPNQNNETPVQHITRAMKYGVTRTDEVDRGKGTKNMEEATIIRNNSLMFIGSNNAIYIKAEGQNSQALESRLPFDGTLVEWQICIHKEESNDVPN